jgi:hypothetical protein
VARYWPTTVAATAVTPRVECDGHDVPVTPAAPAPPGPAVEQATAPPPAPASRTPGTAPGDLEVPLWVLVGARSGDKGGDANVGVWADGDETASWLQRCFTTEAFRAALPEAEPYEVDRHPLPNLRAVNFVVHGILGWGVASNLRLDTQAKGLGELLRSRSVVVPSSLVSSGPAAVRYADWRDGA